MLSWWSARSRDLKGLLWNPSGAPCSCSLGKILIRSAVCGQVTAHLPQSVHRSGSQIGRSWAIARFSHWDVAVGHVPSAGMALTGSRSPSPRSRRAVTWRTNSGASLGIGGIRCSVLVASAGILTSVSYTHLRAHETDSYLVCRL